MLILIVGMLLISVPSTYAAIAGSNITLSEDIVCEYVFVDITGSLPIEEDFNGREYDLIGCEAYELSEILDRWTCHCENLTNITMSTRINSLNNYTVKMDFYSTKTQYSDTTRRRLSGPVFLFEDRCPDLEWGCSDWGPCIDGERIRNCVWPDHACPDIPSKPPTVLECDMVEGNSSWTIINDDFINVSIRPSIDQDPSSGVRIEYLVFLLLLCVVIALLLIELKYSKK